MTARSPFRPLVALAILGAVATSNAELIGLSSSSPASLYSISSSNGAATFLTAVNGANGASLSGLEFLRGTLYATDVAVGNSRRFGTIDLMSGAFTAINDQNGNLNYQSLAADEDANLFYTYALGTFGGGDLVSITPSGTITTIGTTGESITGLAYDNGADVLYGVSPSQLFRINVATGAATLVGNHGVSNSRTGLAFDGATGTLYLNLGAGSGANNALYTVNVATGAATLVGANGVTAGSGIDGLAYRPTPVPEPATLAALSLGVVACWRRRPKSRA